MIAELGIEAGRLAHYLARIPGLAPEARDRLLAVSEELQGFACYTGSATG